MINAYFIPGLIVGNEVYEDLDLDVISTLFGIDLKIHSRPRGLSLIARAAVLELNLKRIFSGQKYWLIGHSAGGLDIRELLYRYPYIKENVLGMITMGTPHGGSHIADKILNENIHNIILAKEINLLAERVNQVEKIIREVSVAGMVEYNKTHQLDEEILNKFHSIGFYIDAKWKCNITSWSSYEYLKKLGFDKNDGTISLSNQFYGKHNYEMIGEHKAETVPVRYGLPFQTIWMQSFKKCFEIIRSY